VAGALLPAQAAAEPEDAPAPVQSEKGPAAPQQHGTPGFPKLGAYAAVGVPYVDVGKGQTTWLGQNHFVMIANPVGIVAHVDPEWSFDFGITAMTPLNGLGGPTEIFFEPGVTKRWGTWFTSLHVGHLVDAPANVSLIPIINKGFPMGSVAWVVGMTFPTMLMRSDLHFNAILQTGIAL
jgi:hypothetical protein